MHKEFLRLLENATGHSEHVIVVNLDIRGFTSFCQTVNPLDVATYIKKVYLTILNNYFKSTSYYKPTGDGLIIIIPFTEKTLKEVANSTIDSCLNLLENFASLLAEDQMINYPTPQKIGIGLTRGSACCILSKDNSEDKILDYSGGILNLASRLMDLARPSGIVIDDSFGIGLLKDETKELFSEDTVYLKGVAEENPRKIHYTRKHTLIPESSKQPIKELQWKTETYEYPYKQVKKFTRTICMTLEKKPSDENKILVEISHDNPNLDTTTLHNFFINDDEISLEHVGNKYEVRMEFPAINKKALEKEELPDDIIIKIKVMYPIK